MAMDLQTLHTDGANFYQYLRGNPFMGSDPLGLSSDPFDMVDDFIGRWHNFADELALYSCHGLPALRMPVCLCTPPLRTPDPPHTALLPTQPRLCARRSRNRSLSAKNSNIFFFSASNHLGPTTPDF